MQPAAAVTVAETQAISVFLFEMMGHARHEHGVERLVDEGQRIGHGACHIGLDDAREGVELPATCDPIRTCGCVDLSESESCQPSGLGPRRRLPHIIEDHVEALGGEPCLRPACRHRVRGQLAHGWRAATQRHAGKDTRENRSCYDGSASRRCLDMSKGRLPGFTKPRARFLAQSRKRPGSVSQRAAQGDRRWTRSGDEPVVTVQPGPARSIRRSPDDHQYSMLAEPLEVSAAANMASVSALSFGPKSALTPE